MKYKIEIKRDSGIFARQFFASPEGALEYLNRHEDLGTCGEFFLYKMIPAAGYVEVAYWQV